MSPRPRSRSDREIFAATHRVISEVGPGGLTLARVADEVGLSPAALLQRFGSKRQLLVAFVEHGVDATARQLRERDREGASALESLLTLLSETEGFADTPEQLGNHAAFLHMDLTDPDFHRPTLRHFRLLLDETRSLLERASSAGEISPGGDLEALARTLLAIRNGGLLNWAIERRGSAADYVRTRLRHLLECHASQPG
ncbi:MAG: TetR/AcrR family transcriptional regulator [Acidobacteriota bacterium]